MKRLPSTVREFLPEPVVSLVRPLYHVLWRGSLKLDWWIHDKFKTAKSAQTIPPARLRFRVGECNEIGVFQAVGEQTAKKIQNALSEAGYPFEDFRSVLDFGCGCGRTLVWLCRAFPGIKWHGTDVDAEAIEWCRENIAGGTFTMNGKAPPLGYRDETFDFIYAISVFTHLNGDAQRVWTQELRRIVKRGGIVLLTTHSEFTWKNLGEAEAVEREGHVFRTSGKLRGILPEWYHTTFQTKEYTLGILSEHFEILKHFSNGGGEQDIFVVRRARLDEAGHIAIPQK